MRLMRLSRAFQRQVEMAMVSGKAPNFNALSEVFMESMGGDPLLVQYEGEAMAPTFKSGYRMLCRPREGTEDFPLYPVQRNDVVVVMTDEEQAVVRRVVAVEGDEMGSTDPDDEPFTLESGCVWVTCDNPESTHDSRVFGPVNADQSILARVVLVRDEDTSKIEDAKEGDEKESGVLDPAIGVVNNSKAAMAADKLFLEAYYGDLL